MIVPAPSLAVGDLDVTAAAFAAGDLGDAEEMIAALAADAIRYWRLDEAIFWQRVKFRARLLRAAGERDAARRQFGRE